MKETSQVVVEIKGVLGISKPFPQGGSWRLTIPKRVVERYELSDKIKRDVFFSYVFLDTDKGLLLLPLDKIVSPENIREALK